MPLRNLNHFLVLAHDLEATRDFYEKVLGLRVGARPPFGFPGYWLYLGDQAVVHLAGGDRGATATASEAGGTGALDHIAFEASGLEETLERLESQGIAAQRRTVPGAGLQQLFIRDPNGVKIELNFPASEKTGTEN